MLTIVWRRHIISQLEIANGSTVPKRNDGFRKDSAFSCALTGNTSPTCRLFRRRNAVSCRFWRHWLCLCVQFKVYRALPEWKPRRRSVRWTYAGSAAFSERRRVSDATFAVQCPMVSVSSAQVQRRCSEQLMVTVHGHDPRRHDLQALQVSARRRSVTVRWDHPSVQCYAIGIPFKWNGHRSKHQFVPFCVTGVLWFGVIFNWYRVENELRTPI